MLRDRTCGGAGQPVAGPVPRPWPPEAQPGGTIARAPAGELEGNSRDGHHVAGWRSTTGVPPDDRATGTTSGGDAVPFRYRLVGLRLDDPRPRPATSTWTAPVIPVRVALGVGVAATMVDEWLVAVLARTSRRSRAARCGSPLAYVPGRSVGRSGLEQRARVRGAAGGRSVRVAVPHCHGGSATVEQIDAHQTRARLTNGWGRCSLVGASRRGASDRSPDLDAPPSDAARTPSTTAPASTPMVAAVAALLASRRTAGAKQALPLLVAAGLLTSTRRVIAVRYYRWAGVAATRVRTCWRCRRARPAAGAGRRFRPYTDSLPICDDRVLARSTRGRTTVAGALPAAALSEDEVRAVRSITPRRSHCLTCRCGRRLLAGVGPAAQRPSATSARPSPAPPQHRRGRAGTRCVVAGPGPAARPSRPHRRRCGSFAALGRTAHRRGPVCSPRAANWCVGTASRSCPPPSPGTAAAGGADRTTDLVTSGAICERAGPPGRPRRGARPCGSPAGRRSTMGPAARSRRTRARRRDSRQFVHLVDLVAGSGTPMPCDDTWGAIVAVHGGAV